MTDKITLKVNRDLWDVAEEGSRPVDGRSNLNTVPIKRADLKKFVEDHASMRKLLRKLGVEIKGFARQKEPAVVLDKNFVPPKFLQKAKAEKPEPEKPRKKRVRI